MFFKDRDVLFVHIPKCGGNTVMRYFDVWHGDPKEPMHYKLHRYENIDQKKYNRSFKFTFVRNIFQQAVSLFEYIKNHVDELKYYNFEKFIFSNNRTILGLHEDFRHLKFINNKKGKLDIDYIGDINNPLVHFENICKKINYPFHDKIKRANRTVFKPYTDFLNDRIINFMQEKFKEEIEFFGYEPYNLKSIKNVGFIKNKLSKKNIIKFL